MSETPIRWETPPSWTCGLNKEAFPSVVAEGDRSPLADGCSDGRGAALLVALSDQSNFSRVFTAAEIASIFLEQFPRSWRIQQKSSRVIALPQIGTEAAWVELIGRGDGVSLAQGVKPTLALWVDIPVTYARRSRPEQKHLLFVRIGLRAQLPEEASDRTARLTQLRGIGEAFLRTITFVGDAIPISPEIFEAWRRLRDAELPSAQAVPEATGRGTAPTSRETQLSEALLTVLRGETLSEGHRALLKRTRDDFPDTTLGRIAGDALQAWSRTHAELAGRELWRDSFSRAAEHEKSGVAAMFLAATVSAGDGAFVTEIITTMEKANVDSSAFSDRDFGRLLDAALALCGTPTVTLPLPFAAARLIPALRHRGVEVRQLGPDDVKVTRAGVQIRKGKVAAETLVAWAGQIGRVSEEKGGPRFVPFVSLLELSGRGASCR